MHDPLKAHEFWHRFLAVVRLNDKGEQYCSGACVYRAEIIPAEGEKPARVGKVGQAEPIAWGKDEAGHKLQEILADLDTVTASTTNAQRFQIKELEHKAHTATVENKQLKDEAKKRHDIIEAQEKQIDGLAINLSAVNKNSETLMNSLANTTAELHHATSLLKEAEAQASKLKKKPGWLGRATSLLTG